MRKPKPGWLGRNVTAGPDDAEVESRLEAAHSALDEADELMEVLRHTIRRAKSKVLEARSAVQEEETHVRR